MAVDMMGCGHKRPAGWWVTETPFYEGFCKSSMFSHGFFGEKPPLIKGLAISFIGGTMAAPKTLGIAL
jgi:hypothetical protein